MKTKKELKSDYKNIRFPMGVFQIRNQVNGKIFVGSSMNLEKIFNRHRFELEMGSHRNTSLQKDWNEFGAESFVYEILGEVKYEAEKVVNYDQEVKIMEEMFLEELQPFGEKGYN